MQVLLRVKLPTATTIAYVVTTIITTTITTIAAAILFKGVYCYFCFNTAASFPRYTTIEEFLHITQKNVNLRGAYSSYCYKKKGNNMLA